MYGAGYHVACHRVRVLAHWARPLPLSVQRPPMDWLGGNPFCPAAKAQLPRPVAVALWAPHQQLYPAAPATEPAFLLQTSAWHLPGSPRMSVTFLFLPFFYYMLAARITWSSPGCAACTTGKLLLELLLNLPPAQQASVLLATGHIPVSMRPHMSMVAARSGCPLSGLPMPEATSASTAL